MTVALEATDTTLEEVLEHAASGDEVQLTRHGHTVATVKPENKSDFAPLTSEQKARARVALASMDERAKRLGLKFSFEDIKAARDFGRR